MKPPLLLLTAAFTLALAVAPALAQTPPPPDSAPTAAPVGTPGQTPTARQAAEQPAPLVTPAPGAEEQVLADLEQDWATATMKRDIAFLERFEAEEYVYTDPSGQLSTKQDSLEAAKAGGFKVESFKIRDVKVHMYGDTAVLTGQTQLKGKDGGEDISGNYRWTDVFVRRDGRWQVVASQATAVQSEE